MYSIYNIISNVGTVLLLVQKYLRQKRVLIATLLLHGLALQVRPILDLYYIVSHRLNCNLVSSSFIRLGNYIEFVYCLLTFMRIGFKSVDKILEHYCFDSGTQEPVKV